VASNLTQKLINAHREEGVATPGEEIGLRIDQTLTQDATGTMVMLALEAMELDQVRTELSVQYVDHNLLQEDHKNPDDHVFLQSACRRYGVWFSGPGNGVSHPVHQQYFGKPGKTLLGSDSHTPAAGSMGMLAIGAGGLDVAMTMAGHPFYTIMPEVWGIRLVGELPEWVSAKDLILKLLRRHGVRGGAGRILEYHGPGLASLSAMDRHVIANMGTELGATTTVFPADEEVRRYLRSYKREQDWSEWLPDEGATYDAVEEIDLSRLVPLIAMPSSPDNVVPVHEVAGEEIYQAYIGSSANPGYRDFAVVAAMVRDKHIHPRVSFDINPTSRGTLEDLVNDSSMASLIHAGARVHQAGCNGCIGMGQAPATDKLSLRTVPRNFPGRSGTREDKVCLVSPETAAASALTGKITDPRDLDMPYPRFREPESPSTNEVLFLKPRRRKQSSDDEPELVKGPNIKPIPEFGPLPGELDLPVVLEVGDNVSTDEILPAGTRVLPYRSNIPAISRFAFEPIDEGYPERAEEARERGHAIVAGENYGQGSSREHAALAPRYLGLRMVIARSFARIHRHNLVNCGILPLVLNAASEDGTIQEGDRLKVTDLRRQLADEATIRVINETKGREYYAQHRLSSREREVLLAGGLFNWVRRGN